MPESGYFDFSEEDVRGWCDGVTFARADALQQAGHVQVPETHGLEMTAEVLGTWSRVDRTSLVREGARLHSRCTCGASTLCAHSVAMLLQWVRRPESFRSPASERDGPLTVDAYRSLTPQEQMEELLHRRTLSDLRALAKRRGLTVKSQLKDEYVARLAVLLLQPENIAVALESLGDEELLLLTLIDVLRQSAGAAAPRVHRAFAVVQRRSRPGSTDRDTIPPHTAVSRPEELGLLIRPSYPGGPYDVPRAVAGRIRVPQALLDLLPNRAVAEKESGLEVRQASLIDLIQMIALAVSRGEAEAHVPPEPKARYSGQPVGWDMGDRDAGRGAPGRQGFIPASVRLVPQKPVIPDRDRNRLARQVGASADELELVAELMVELHILQRRRGSDTLTVEREQLDRLLTLEGAARWRALASAWLALPAVSDLRLLGDVLELRVSAMHVQWYGLELLDERGFRGMFSRLIGHLASEPRWHSASDLAGLCEMIAPDALQRMQETVPTWWFTPRGRPHEPLMANAPEGRRHIYSAILDALLRGPLRWLQMVDLIESDAELLFRPRPRAAILADREPDVSAEDTGTASLSIEADEDGTPVLTLSFSGGDEMALYLSVVSEPLRPSAQGMRYSVSGLALQRMFADGLQGPMLIAWLERSSRNGVPESVRDRIERAWKSYGRVRLYDDLTLVELGDDFLLRELEALTDLPDATIHVFSPRLLAIDPERVQSVVAALTKAGYRPRLLEGA